MNTVPVWATTIMVAVFTPLAVSVVGMPPLEYMRASSRRRRIAHVIFGVLCCPLICGMAAGYFGLDKRPPLLPASCTAVFTVVRCYGDHSHNARTARVNGPLAKSADERTPRRGHLEE